MPIPCQSLVAFRWGEFKNEKWLLPVDSGPSAKLLWLPPKLVNSFFWAGGGEGGNCLKSLQI